MRSSYGYLRSLLLISLTASLLVSCSIRRHIPEDEYLLRKVKINVKGKGAPPAYKDDLYALLRQKPNNSVLGLIRPNMWFYIWASDKRKERKGEEKLAKGAWEKPVLLDSSLLDASAGQMDDYLFSQGYFHAEVKYKVKTHGRRAKVRYNVRYGDVYIINRVDRHITDPRIAATLRTDTSVSVIGPGVKYSANILTEERERITAVLRNNGYYNFSREYIYFEIDSTLPGRFVNVGLRISTPPQREHHLVYMIDKVTVEPEFFGLSSGSKDTFKVNDIAILGESNRVRTSVILGQVFFEKGELYQYSDYQRTLNRLSQLKLYKFVDIQFHPDTVAGGDTAKLDVYIRLNPLDRQEVSADFEINTTEETIYQLSTSSQRYYGTAISLVYRHRNLFKSAVQLEVRPRFAIEVPTQAIIDAPNQIDTPSYEYGLSNSFIFPRLLIPFVTLPERAPNLFTQSAVNLNAIVEKNKFFDRTTFNANLTYYINRGNIRHFVTPIEVSLVNTDFSNDSFANIVFATGDPLLINIFDQHIITDFRYTFMYNQPLLVNPVSRYWNFRNTFEIGGNVPGLIDNIFDLDESTDRLTKELFEISYYQYLKNEIELRYYRPVFRRNILAFRGIFGVGLPYGNSQVLPFEKRFSVGGANSMRAWQLRELGPGSFKDEDGVQFDNTGDIKIELNAEYRFPIISWLQGAFFTDAGNVWTYNTGNRPGSRFHIDSFYRQIAVAAGFGARLDFSFFVFRVDMAVPVADPTFPEGQKLVIRNIDERKWLGRNINFSIGIGYPF